MHIAVCREHVLGDLHERYSGPWQYLFDAAGTVPRVVLSQARRNANPPVLLMECAALYLAMAAAGWGLAGPTYFSAQSGILQVGRSLGSATLDVSSGGHVDSVFYTSVGRGGIFGMLNVDGNGRLYRIDSTATAAANGVTSAAVMDIGRNGGNGTVNVTRGARLELLATTATTGGMGLSLGRDVASAGTLNIASGGVVEAPASALALALAPASPPPQCPSRQAGR